LKSFIGEEKDLLFAEITPSIITKFEAHLYTLSNERDSAKNLHPNHIEVLMSLFKRIINRTITIDYKLRQEYGRN